MARLEGVGATSETQPYLILIRLSRPRIAVLRLAARSPGHGMQRGGWCCAPFALRRRRSSKSCSVTRQQLLQLWQDTLPLVQGGSGQRQPAAMDSDAGAMTDVSTPSA